MKRVLLAGQVVDAMTREGIGGAIIEEICVEKEWEGGVPCFRLGEATTPMYAGTDGSFQLEVTPTDTGLLRVSAEGYAPGMYRIRDPARLLREGWTLALVPAARLIGTVYDQDGLPVDGAKVHVRPAQAPAEARDPGLAFLMVPGHTRFHGRYAARACPSAYCCRVVETGGGGRYEVTGLPAGSFQDIWAEHDGRATTVASNIRIDRRPSGGHDPRFVKLSTLTVQVRYPDGTPVQSGRIILVDSRSRRNLAEVRLGDDGVAVFRHLHPGERLIRGRAGGPVYERVVIEAGEDTAHNITADADAPPPSDDPKGTTVAHTLVDEQERPVSGAEIDVKYGRSMTTVRSDASGRFSYTRRPSRAPKLEIRAAGYHTLELESWRVRKLTERVTLQRLIHLTVTATFPRDHPPTPKASVVLRDESGMGHSRDLVWERTEPRKAILRVDAWPGLDWLEFFPDGHVRFDLWVGVDGKASKLSKEVVLEPGVVLPVRVQGAAGPIAGARVYVTQELECGWNQQKTTTGEDGLATVAGIAPGVPFELSVRAEDHTPFEETWTREMGASETEVRLQAVGVLTGRVLDAVGLPVAGAQIRPHRERGKPEPARWQWAESDESGRFRLSLDAGTHRIVFTGPSGSGLRAETRDIEVSPGNARDMDVRLKSR